MKKMRKIFAVLLTLAMVLAMSMTAFAAEFGTKTNDTASLTVSGLVPGEATEVSVYKVVGWDEAASSWTLEQNVTAADVVLANKPVTINWSNFVDKRTTLTRVGTMNTTDGTATFHGLEIGAYYVYAGSEHTNYNPMGEAVYEYGNDGLMKPADKTIDAKGSTYNLTKAFTGANGTTTYQVVERGQEVPFTITAVFPSYGKDAKDRAFQITDEPTGMKVTGVTVKVGNDTLNLSDDTYKLVSVNEDGSDGDEITLPATEGQKVRVRFTSTYIGTKNAHAGQTVTVNVTAQITDADTFSNTASSDKGSNTPNVNGKLGSITINKYDETYNKDSETGEVTGNLLAGAEFSITPVKEGATEIKFVHVSDDETNKTSIYKKATAEEIANEEITKVTSIVAKYGKVVAKGLDDGDYTIVETKAPKGYSVVDVPNVKIINGDNPVATADVKDTKLNALPHTGGIGTTIFTIAGCLIMVTAAGLFFASRKRTNK
ncbi:SpaA isopeptide-forming pilin-related protein [Blautia obeum]|uniref:LPXTG cell wall anchor domain-containing protein n=1 Tax=Blautia obeum TaxID=40520 RepID=A0A414KCN4_9FIRM|nr:SpaA isopeptide-forming pilin-related protein [Blautia obeum]RGQ03810.1 LPXTG cell wall anchor domain-containing protein [Blautia obeum]RHE73304.1 LPXTG cell wall anchor domain-containing protein [Blautia obeum]